MYRIRSNTKEFDLAGDLFRENFNIHVEETKLSSERSLTHFRLNVAWKGLDGQKIGNTESEFPITISEVDLENQLEPKIQAEFVESQMPAIHLYNARGEGEGHVPLEIK